MSSETVCAVVVTYNRKELLIECLEALENQSRPVDAIYIVDNASTDGTSELLLEKNYLGDLPSKELKENFEETIQKGNTVIHYLRMSKNTGGAGGFHEGVKNAYKKGYEWLWLMDDDAEPFADALENLSKYSDGDNVSALAGVVKEKNKITSRHRGFFDFKKFSIWSIIDKVDLDLIKNNALLEIDFASFVGILVNKKSISEVGFPKKEFFVYGDDFEYCIRLKNVGRILLVTDSIIQHKAGSSKNFLEKNMFGHRFARMYYEKYWLNYFSIRNTIWILKRNRKPTLYFWIVLVISWFFNNLLIILFDDNKSKRLNFLTSAYNDGLKGNFDNEKPKEILYK